MEGVIEQYRKSIEDQGIKPRSKESADWFAKKMKELIEPIDRRKLQREAVALRGYISPHVGRMYVFFYRPKGYKSLPYYDIFPTTIMMNIQKEYFQGLNLHYLPLDIRQEFFSRLLERSNKKIYDKQTFFRIDYDYLKSLRRFRAFKPCFKTYDYKNVMGRIINVPSSEWEIVMNLPTAVWRKAPEQMIHARSRKEYRSS